MDVRWVDRAKTLARLGRHKLVVDKQAHWLLVLASIWRRQRDVVCHFVAAVARAKARARGEVPISGISGMVGMICEPRAVRRKTTHRTRHRCCRHGRHRECRRERQTRKGRSQKSRHGGLGSGFYTRLALSGSSDRPSLLVLVLYASGSLSTECESTTNFDSRLESWYL